MRAFLIRRVFLIAVIALTIGLGFFVGINGAMAREDNGDKSAENLIITEIMHEPEGSNAKHSKWIEIKNNGSEKIILYPFGKETKAGFWKIKGLSISDASSHYLYSSQSNPIEIKGGKYFIITKNIDSFKNDYHYPNKPENLIVLKSALTLSRAKTKQRKYKLTLYYDNKELDSVPYFKLWGGNDNGRTLEKINLNSSNLKSNWRESYVLGGTPGAENSKKPKPKNHSSKIRINELVPNPKGSDRDYEYIELYNYGDKEIDLENWEFKDANILKKRNKKGKKLSGIILPKKYSAFYKTVSLNNNGDKIKLFNPKGDEIDSVGYGKAKENFSYSFNGGKWEWTPFLTPGKANQFKVKKNYIHTVYINEILPNPHGDEKLNEYIELYNFGDQIIDLSGWILKDSSKSGKFIFPDNSRVDSRSFLLIYRPDFKFAMNNSGAEKICLLDPNKKTASRVSYFSAKENISYNFNGRGWRWSRFLTPGAENKFNSLPKIEIKKDKKVYKNIYADFKVKINDPDEDKIKVVWDFGDGRKSYKKKTRHKYKETGKYSASLKVFDGSEEIIKKFKIKVKKFPRPKVRITRLLPNPKGKDSELEWIEIKNKSKKEINLKNWSIAAGSSDRTLTNHPIYEDFFIRPGKVKKIMRNLSKFSLNNKKCRIELRYPDGKIAYKIKYKREDGIKDDEIYEKMKGGKWQWTKKSVPDVLNVETVLNVEDVKDVLNVEIVENDEDEEDDEDEGYIGGQSLKLSGNKELELLAGELRIKKAGNIAAVLGASAIKRTSDSYVFNSPAGRDRHYALKFLEKLFQEINQALNNWINLLN